MEQLMRKNADKAFYLNLESAGIIFAVENINDRKPYCVECPQALMTLVLAFGSLGLLFGVFFCGVELWSAACAFALLGLIIVGCMLKRGRRVLFGREMTTFVFAILAAISICLICHSKESWYTVPTCEEEIPVWNGSWRRDPGGEKVCFLMLATI